MSFYKNYILPSITALMLVACGGGSETSPTKQDATSTTPASTVTLKGKVADSSNAALAGVTVSFGSASTLSDASGNYSLSVPTNTNALNVVSFSKAGYALQTRTTPAAFTTQASVNVNALLLPVALNTQFNGSTAQTLSDPNSSAQVVLTANSLVRADGSAPTAPIQIELTPINPNLNGGFMPGFMGTSDAALIESNGAIQVTFTDTADGTKLQLGAGKTATIRIPAVSRGGVSLPATIDLYYLDEVTGFWVKDGTATLKGSGTNQYFEGTVTHFSSWNADKPYDTVYINGCVSPIPSSAIFSTLIYNNGVNYVGSSQAVVNATTGQFKIPVKKNAVSRIYASDFNASSATQDVTVGAIDVTLTTCLTLNQETAPTTTFPVATSVTTYQGTYTGTYTGVENGTFSVVVDNNGFISGRVNSITYGITSTVSGTVGASGQAVLNASGSAGSAVFTALFRASAAGQTVSGTWRYTTTPSTLTNGTLTGARTQ